MKTILWTCDTCWTEQELIVYDNGATSPAVCGCCGTTFDEDAITAKLNEDQMEVAHDAKANA